VQRREFFALPLNEFLDHAAIRAAIAWQRTGNSVNTRLARMQQTQQRAGAGRRFRGQIEKDRFAWMHVYQQMS